MAFRSPRAPRSPPWLTWPAWPDIALLVGRGWFGLVLAVSHGLPKVLDLAEFTAGVARRGIPLPGLLGPLAAASELVGGLLLALGLLARPAALAVIATMLVAAFHAHAADPFVKKELALAYAMGALVVVIAGPGRFSLDHRLWGTRPRS